MSSKPMTSLVSRFFSILVMLMLSGIQMSAAQSAKNHASLDPLCRVEPCEIGEKAELPSKSTHFVKTDPYIKRANATVIIQDDTLDDF